MWKLCINISLVYLVLIEGVISYIYLLLIRIGGKSHIYSNPGKILCLLKIISMILYIFYDIHTLN
jgi:hypothetical protein